MERNDYKLNYYLIYNYIMSLQNLVKRNNYKLNCNELRAVDIYTGNIETLEIETTTVTAHDANVDSLLVDKIYKHSSPYDEIMDLNASSTNINLYKNIIPNTNNTINLGQNSFRFGQLHITEIYGPPESIAVENSLSGPLGSTPLQLQYGSVVVGNNQSTFNKYYELSSSVSPDVPASVSGPFASSQTVNYIGTRIGNFVSLRISFNLIPCTNTLSNILLNNFGVNFGSSFIPSNIVYFTIPIRTSASTVVECLGSINTAGNINITSLSGGLITFTSGDSVGLGIPNGSYFQINYNI